MDSRLWTPEESAAFCRAKDKWGAFSNMAGGFPLVVSFVDNGPSMWLGSSEALYQALGFPDAPTIQATIMGANSGFAAKLVMKPHRAQRRADWEKVKVPIMRWCLQLKLAQHRAAFTPLLEELGAANLHVVELSVRDPFWGAQPAAGGLRGANMLGRLWMEVIREGWKGDRPAAPALGLQLLGRALA
jgi:predicted NAD-dependent protein-ADP-ribosyltransferase YbiA (DUF1768 family)